LLLVLKKAEPRPQDAAVFAKLISDFEGGKDA
jgi:hypothetical protein